MNFEEPDYESLESVMADANQELRSRTIQSRVVDAAMAARAAFHAQIADNALTPVPPELAIAIAQMAFAAAWNSSDQD